VTNFANELQRNLLRDDAFLYRVPVEDSEDISFSATITASSKHPSGPVAKLIDGHLRNRPELRPEFIKNKHSAPPPEDGVFEQGSAWVSTALNEDPQPWLRLQLNTPRQLREIRPIFDSNLSFDITQSSRTRGGREGMPITLVRNYTLTAWRDDEQIWEASVTDNRRRNPMWTLSEACGAIDSIESQITRIWGSGHARVFAIRCLPHGGNYRILNAGNPVI
jgi:hypothetical protein